LTLVIIEHDIPLIMSISDRIIAMADGMVIADGPPEFVRNHPAVVDAYLGGSITAIERSGNRTEVAPTTSERIETVLSTVPGLGAARTRRLIEAFGSNGSVADATVDELMMVRGVGAALARRIRNTLDEHAKVSHR
jgi:energy-coupling factor transporter ATP-binding protein EcfA2